MKKLREREDSLTSAKDICCSLNIFARSFPIVGTLIDLSNSTNSCTKNSGSVPNGRLEEDAAMILIIAPMHVLDVDEWVRT